MLGMWLDASNCMCVCVVGQHVWIGAGGYILAEMSIKCLPRPRNMPPAHWKGFRGREQVG